MAPTRRDRIARTAASASDRVAASRTLAALLLALALAGCGSGEDKADSTGGDAAALDAAALDAAALDAADDSGATDAASDSDAFEASDIAADASATTADAVGADDAVAADIAADALTDATDAATAADVAADVPADAGADALCPVTSTPPPPNEDWGSPAKVDTSACSKDAPAFFKGEPPPAESLEIEVGAVDNAGVFHPYSQDGWVPMTHGPQGGFHVYVGLRYTFPGATEPKQKVQVEGQLYDGCELTGYGLAPVVYPANVGGSVYVLGEAGLPGMNVIFNKPGTMTGQSSSASKEFCNRYFDLRVSAREFKSGKWGSKTVRIRTYDTPHAIGGDDKP